MPEKNLQYKGLGPEAVIVSREKHGANLLKGKSENAFWAALKGVITEPMVLLLLAASSIYFITGNTGDGLFLVSAILLVAAISLYQDSRSRSALEKLQQFTHPKCKVIREGVITEIDSEELVVGDYLVVEEGGIVAGDGALVQSNDFSVNESILTGESFSVEKNPQSESPLIFQGTTVVSGLGIAEVSAVGNQTKLGQIGKSLDTIADEKTPLEKQIGNFVKKMVVGGAVVFVIVWGINFFRSGDFADSLLKALTLAMSILPEEIPVAFTTFMALGAWRLMKMGIVVKQMKTVESLGSATVICTDKTGTLTENKMSLARLYVHADQTQIATENAETAAAKNLIRTAMWASEPLPFDPMEIALHKAYGKAFPQDERPNYEMVHEYALGGKPPMMTHVFESGEGDRIIAAKGAPEAMIAVSQLTESEKESVLAAMNALAQEGYRVLGVGQAVETNIKYPVSQQEIPFQFLGLVAFYDPPKGNIEQVFKDFYGAGISVKIVTGDNAATTGAIARQIGFKGADQHLTGDALMALSDSELENRVQETQLYTRMFPEAKLRIIDALKKKGEIVAMTGDGVNDGPALKSAHIGIAMGKRGTEIAKQAASLVLVEDDLSKMVDAIAMGRRIYTNLKKAIRYIISIHIPIILTVFIPLVLAWRFPHIFSPVHIILLELIMGPTCSIIYENEPMEKNTLLQPPRPFSSTFFNWTELIVSILQGLVITAGILLVYQYGVREALSETLTRTLVFTTLISANIFLTLINRSFIYSIFTTLRYKNRLVPVIIGITVALLAALVYIPPLAQFFNFCALGWKHLGLAVGVGFVSVIWFEGVKFLKRRKEVEP